MQSIDILNFAETVPPSNQLADTDLLDMLTMMLRIRQFETSTIDLFDQGKIKGTAHSSIGQEAIAAGACHALEDNDFILTHHRGHGHTIAKGADINRMMAELLGKANGYCFGLGGSMHIADFERNILGANGIVGAGMGLGTGAALAEQIKNTNAVGIAFFGDGAASEGIFHEALNLAAIWKLPLIFFCENNHYGLTTATKDVISGGGIARRAVAYDIPGHLIDGNDVAAVHDTVLRAAMRARSGEGPTLIEAMTYRWGDHSMRANLPSYRAEEEELEWRLGDPIDRLRDKLKERHAIDDLKYKELIDSAAIELEDAIKWAAECDEPTLDAAKSLVTVKSTELQLAEPPAGNRNLTYSQAINEAMKQEMERDENVILIGEDVGKTGGIFGLTRDLQQIFGGERVRDTPIAEGAISSCGVGAAMMGLRPIVEIQIFDFVALMMDAIVNQAAKARFMMGGKPKVPVVFRGPQGAGIRLAAQHGQSLEAWFAHVPGLEVYMPSNAYDAKGLMAAAIRSDNPVVFLEHKLLYQGGETPVPQEPYVIKPGKARIVREGTDCTVIALMAMVERAEQAANRLEKQGISVEIIDPRTIKPLDMESIINSVKKTNRAVVVHEAVRFGGIGAEIAATISEEAFDWLDAPVGRIGAIDMPVPYNDRLERDYLPDAKNIAEAIKKVCYVK
ncbi:pyruvate dehydrogenase complex E1 component subunit beta [Sneathiella sp.]|uniref:alpha-ketoacid dehydrogenase subunit alpha/beta n=1 Tax=Sneathiella sp. TaxID=1964365 RepID=UPI0035638279